MFQHASVLGGRACPSARMHWLERDLWSEDTLDQILLGGGCERAFQKGHAASGNAKFPDGIRLESSMGAAAGLLFFVC